MQRSLSEAIRKSALSVLRGGKRHNHQRRIPRAVLLNAEQTLQAAKEKIENLNSFDQLHDLVREEIGKIKGIGSLAIYDITHRIAAFLQFEPQKIYLHAGTRLGARFLGLSGDVVESNKLPKVFSKLSPAEIEDCLCIYAEEISRITRSTLKKRSLC